MKFFKNNSSLILIYIVLISLFSCEPKIPVEQPLVIREDPETVAERIKKITENTAIQVIDGMNLTLWATDSLAPDPIAMSIDDFGNVYLTRTNRQKNSEFDIRGYRNWMTASIALESVEERRDFLRTTFSKENSSKNEWLKDLNNDGIHDWRDLTVEKDEIWKLEDEDGDGIADISTRVLSDFNEEITDVAGALLVRNDDVFLGIGPDMWRLKDKNNDGVLENKTSISHGYGVHIGFSGHGMSGAIEGPDGKIYWGIGDIGANITALDGSKYKYPNQGVIVRSNPDGSNFEVFAAGVRNTHEFVFDTYGNLISSDNDGDHPGEKERLVYLVDGSDSGWRANWQYGKYTDPKNNKYKVWMDEVLYKPRWEGQAAYIIPPIMNFHNGPTGMAYNPGTALSSRWKNNFFLVEFAGNPARSNIWSFTLQPAGASFELKEEKNVVNGILPTGIRFGPDGALYAADWINGWGTKNYGRVWKLDVDESENDLKKERKETEHLMQLSYKDQSDEELLKLLSYDDMRIRLKAQFELAKRKSKGFKIFKQAMHQKENQLARVHAIWGIGQLAAEKSSYASELIPFLNDKDPEIIAQAAKVIGDVVYKEAGEALIPLLDSKNLRIQFFAAQALGRIENKEAIASILSMLERNNDQDVYIRHAGVMALTRIGEVEPILALANHQNESLRLAAVLVLRRWQDAKIAIFLKDQNEYIATEVARAINDDWSIEDALRPLAEVLKEERFTSEPLLRRAINASLRVGGESELEMLIDFANREAISAELKAEAIATIGTWANPSVLDRVDGRYRGEIKRDDKLVLEKVKANINNFLLEKDSEILISIAKMLGELSITDYNDELVGIMDSTDDSKVKSEMISTLNKLKYRDIEKIIKMGMEDESNLVRTTSLGLLDQLEISKENLPGIVSPVFENGSTKEQQKILNVLGNMPIEKTNEILDELIDQHIAGKLPQGIALDLKEAIISSKSDRLIAKMDSVDTNDSTLDTYKEALYGGDRRNGYNYFKENSTGQCVRCHSIRGQGGTVGPSLTNIGNELSREEILQALVEPSARLSPGFGTVSLTLTDGQVVTGILMEEREDELIVKTSEAEPMEIHLSRITKRENMPSSMPPMGALMSKREIRDMVQFLSTLKVSK